MAYEAKPGTGTLFRNREKKSDRHPNLKGDALVEIDGQLYQLELAAWTKQSERAGKFLSLSVKLKGARQSTQPRPSEGRQYFHERIEKIGVPLDDDLDRSWGPPPAGDDDIPFVVPYDLSPTRRFRV